MRSEKDGLRGLGLKIKAYLGTRWNRLLEDETENRPGAREKPVKKAGKREQSQQSVTSLDGARAKKKDGHTKEVVLD